MIKDEYVYVEFVNNAICTKLTAMPDDKKNTFSKENQERLTLDFRKNGDKGFPLFHIEFREWTEEILREVIYEDLSEDEKNTKISQHMLSGFNVLNVPFRISKLSEGKCEFKNDSNKKPNKDNGVNLEGCVESGSL